MLDLPTYFYVCGGIILVALIVLAAVKAPKGYEDEDGFHYGDPPAPEELPAVEPVIENPFPNAVQTGIVLEDGDKLILVRKGVATVINKLDFAILD